MRQKKPRVTDDADGVVKDIKRQTRLVPQTALKVRARDLKSSQPTMWIRCRSRRRFCS